MAMADTTAASGAVSGGRDLRARPGLPVPRARPSVVPVRPEAAVSAALVPAALARAAASADPAAAVPVVLAAWAAAAAMAAAVDAAAEKLLNKIRIFLCGRSRDCCK